MMADQPLDKHCKMQASVNRASIKKLPPMSFAVNSKISNTVTAWAEED